LCSCLQPPADGERDITLLILKLTLVPLFLGLISIAGQRFGPNMAGWLAGLPVVVGPILFLVSLEQGAPFAQAAAVYTLASVLGVIAFGVAYSWIARSSNVWLALLAGLATWAAAAAAVLFTPLNPFISAALAFGALIIAPRMYPPQTSALIPARLPAAELLFRMLAGAGLTLAVTTLAQTAGARLSGMLALFPVLTAVLAMFTHRNAGADHAIALLRGLARGLYSLAAFCFALTLLLNHVATPIAFLLSIGIALAVQWLNRAARKA
jgi:uncharacterized membrane protein (GlpM family)